MQYYINSLSSGGPQDAISLVADLKKMTDLAGDKVCILFLVLTRVRVHTSALSILVAGGVPDRQADRSLELCKTR